MGMMCFLNPTRHCGSDCICWQEVKAPAPRTAQCLLLQTIKNVSGVLTGGMIQYQAGPPPEIS
jgi:hypothetical protein